MKHLNIMILLIICGCSCKSKISKEDRELRSINDSVFWGNGSIKEINCYLTNGNRDGIQQVYSENGKLLIDVYYNNGKIQGRWYDIDSLGTHYRALDHFEQKFYEIRFDSSGEYISDKGSLIARNVLTSTGKLIFTKSKDFTIATIYAKPPYFEFEANGFLINSKSDTLDVSDKIGLDTISNELVYFGNINSKGMYKLILKAKISKDGNVFRTDMKDFDILVK